MYVLNTSKDRNPWRTQSFTVNKMNQFLLVFVVTSLEERQESS